MWNSGNKKDYLVPNHPDIAETLYQLARLRQLQQHPDEALSFYKQTLVMREQIFGSQHPKTNAIRIAYIHLLQELGCLEDAAILES